ncbi:unnamed protein product, partial [Vitis vinifera]|uniref:Uncharacterized protein n=1 Tax=Vitis vinifera TaxID=29760 RepID=D7SPE6_VITVI
MHPHKEQHMPVNTRGFKSWRRYYPISKKKETPRITHQNIDRYAIYSIM